MLDVGGYPGLIKDFLNEDETVVVDILPSEEPNYIQTDGTSLPFKANSFDLVCSLDTLEHVPPGNRESFLEEMLRVSKDYIVLICPFFDENIKLAEQITYEFYRKTFSADLEVLGEHLEYGLPDLEEVEQFVNKKGLSFITIPSGYLFNWLPMQVAKIYIQSLPRSEKLNSMIDRFYNENYYEGDHRLPSYRTVLVASKESKEPLAKIAKRFKVETDSQNGELKSFDTFSMLMSLLDLQHKNQMQNLVKEVEATHKMLKEKDVHIYNLERIIAERDNHIQNLERWADRVQRTFSYRAYALVKKVKKNNKTT